MTAQGKFAGDAGTTGNEKYPIISAGDPVPKAFGCEF